MTTPFSRHDADEHLRAAIIAHAEAYGLSAADELLADFAIIAHWQRIEADNTHRYSTHYDRTTIPHHVAVGLFAVAAQHLASRDT